MKRLVWQLQDDYKARIKRCVQNLRTNYNMPNAVLEEALFDFEEKWVTAGNGKLSGPNFRKARKEFLIAEELKWQENP